VSGDILAGMAMSIDNILTIKDDKAFIKDAAKFLEGSQSGSKGLTIIKLNNKGKGSQRQLYLSLAHGDVICHRKTQPSSRFHVLIFFKI
jgi:hypothetical protein